ncbi:putative Ubiquinone biosynthesis protein COQ7 [Trypanosoma vivax]|uniref:Putative ubiquinone biosynthesis protein COQ7 homolog n=1 Tax=Trypanosoma vivax (strain Y486) TaxID=1055687 RepID=G0TTH1_TRYVY|nr:putative ubiquinone biosynthesis protein COQ7 [Trypanosoma vivax]KAH8605802.1 putative Ubiquinone biosynthesis protein COQ7 [Trypanosoma vivax]CCC47252.1 putative ubiquinone biosynthesis protein COQ7 homolog [Trypanosoma vivax Y486]
MYGRSLRFLFSTGFSSTVNGSKKLKISEAIRVDQAGERAAVRICTYQLFWISPLDPSVQIVKEILSDEIVHERVMDKLAEKHYVKTTALDPLFHLGAFAMASLTSFAGKEAIMCCHAAVEETIARHYNDQLRELETVENAEGLSKNEALEWDEVKHYIKTFRDEELHHQELGERNGASDAPAYPILYNGIKLMCSIGIALAKIM